MTEMSAPHTARISDRFIVFALARNCDPVGDGHKVLRRGRGVTSPVYQANIHARRFTGVQAFERELALLLG